MVDESSRRRSVQSTRTKSLFTKLAMSVHCSATFCATGALGGKPIGRVRVNFFNKLLLRNKLEAAYGISIILTEHLDKSLDRPPTAGEFLDPLAAGRGFRTSRGQPDRSRSARLAIKDFLQGRLLHVHPPPSCADHQLFHSSTVETEKDQVKLERRLKMVETKMLQVKNVI